MTRYQKFCEKWSAGCGSTLCHRAMNICLARGSIPCDILMVGEAPGKSEDILGQPFVGPAGHLLDYIIEKALLGIDKTCAFTNVVGCIPLDEDGSKTEEPAHKDILSCRERLTEFVKLANPKLVVAVGNLAETYAEPARMGLDIPYTTITHPAAMLRANAMQKEMMLRRAIVVISQAIKELSSAVTKQKQSAPVPSRQVTSATNDGIPF